MSMKTWAEQECRIACKRENPDYDFDSDDFDYGCACYKSALKAYNSLMEDEHSGYSFGLTKNILIRLLEGQPLTPITDEDFFSAPTGTEDCPLESDEYLEENNLKSSIQCLRMCSLFREETLDGKVTYRDIDRAYFIDVECPSDTYHSSCAFLDDMFPITMPYCPKVEKYKIYAQTFLADKNNGDFDTKGILYMITPEGKRIDLNIFYTEKNGKWMQITEDEYRELLNRRVDRLSEKIANRILCDIHYGDFSSDEERIRAAYEIYADKEIKDKFVCELTKLCEFFEDPCNWKYNTYSVHSMLCKGTLGDELRNVAVLAEIEKCASSFNNYLLQVAEEHEDFPDSIDDSCISEINQ